MFNIEGEQKERKEEGKQKEIKNIKFSYSNVKGRKSSYPGPHRIPQGTEKVDNVFSLNS